MTKRFAAATARNREPILAVLRQWWQQPGDVLEIAAGSGEHALHFAAHLPQLRWQPSDADPGAVASIEAWRAEHGTDNLRPALALDVCAQPWPIGQLDGIFCANMIHIAPWACTLGLMAGAGRHLRPGGLLLLYGPFMIDGAHTAPSNAAFDADLRRRDAAWGVRDRGDVAAVARTAGLTLRASVAMPANNFTLVFERGAPLLSDGPP